MLVRYQNNKFDEIAVNEFKLEKELQQFFETNMFELTGYKFLASEFSIEHYRMDSIAFDEEKKSFVIVEYKRGKNESLVDQGYAYLQTLLTRKADFVLLYNEVTGSSLLTKDFDWSQSIIAFVSPKFTQNQKDATSFMGMAFELYEVRRYEDGLYFVNQLNQRKIPFSETTKIELETINPEISRVNKELTVYDESYHFKTFNSNDFVKTVYKEMKERIFEMDSELEENFTKLYIAYKYDSKHNFVAFWLKKDWIEVVLNMKLGQLKDPYGIAYDISNRKWSAAQYAIKITSTTNVDDIMDLIKQSYKVNVQDGKQ
jgi:predicted transport protein